MAALGMKVVYAYEFYGILID
ncbi:uncharacterized protein G2W53_013374 [Senna tora]|uniref:Uncharacterized protein n=1 Tax=Senna tora TaxID=362788 RepID=A0A834U2E6_9FABA|nr:uncharacterized protein G2W53_013374 [Senna tora]